MEGIVALIVVGLIIGFPVYFLYIAGPARVTNKLHSIKNKKIADVKEGEITSIKGRVIYLGKTFAAPASGRKCVYCHIIVEKEGRNSKGGRNWYEIIDDEMAGDIVIYDGEDYAVINTNLVDSYLVQDREYFSGSKKTAPGKTEEFLKKHGHKLTDLFGFDNEFRYKEGVLEQGEIIAVVGKATWKLQNEFDFKIPAKKILVLTAESDPVYLSDDPFAVSRKIEN